MTSTYSTTSFKTATDEFSITLQEGCISNMLKMDGSLGFSSCGTVIADQQYKVSEAASTTTALSLTPLYSSSLNPTTCPLTATLLVWDDATNFWVDKTLSTT